ncbi:MAG TPA: hypothetical protein VKX17_07550 [Planctomycetota bacterium]|nr:hypothetical protein [Planctomycetota bacterium]
MLASILKKIGAATLLLAASQVLLLLAMRMLSRRLGEQGYGQYGLAMSIGVYSFQFIQWGMDQFLTVKFARGSADESRRLLGVLLRQKQLAALVALAGGGIVAFSAQSSSERALIFLGALDGVIVSFTIPSMFDARGRTATWQFFAFLRHSTYLGALMILAWFFPNYFSPSAVVSIHALCAVVQVLLDQFWIQRNYGPALWPAPARDALELWRSGAPMALAMLAQQAMFYMGLPLLRHFARDNEMGALTLSNQFTIGAASFIGAPAAIIHARLAQHQGEGRAFLRRVLRATILCALAGIALSLAFPFIGGFIVRHVFQNFADSTPKILSIDGWRLAPILASAPLASAVICLNRLRAFATCWIFALLTGLAVAAILIPRFPAAAGSYNGAIGAASAVVAGSFAFFVFSALLLAYDWWRSPAEKAA